MGALPPDELAVHAKFECLKVIHAPCEAGGEDHGVRVARVPPHAQQKPPAITQTPRPPKGGRGRHLFEPARVTDPDASAETCCFAEANLWFRETRRRVCPTPQIVHSPEHGVLDFCVYNLANF